MLTASVIGRCPIFYCQVLAEYENCVQISQEVHRLTNLDAILIFCQRGAPAGPHLDKVSRDGEVVAAVAAGGLVGPY